MKSDTPDHTAGLKDREENKAAEGKKVTESSWYVQFDFLETTPPSHSPPCSIEHEENLSTEIWAINSLH